MSDALEAAAKEHYAGQLGVGLGAQFMAWVYCSYIHAAHGSLTSAHHAEPYNRIHSRHSTWLGTDHRHAGSRSTRCLLASSSAN